MPTYATPIHSGYNALRPEAETTFKLNATHVSLQHPAPALSLPHLLSTIKCEVTLGTNRVVCRNALNGYCTLGHRCHRLHVKTDDESWLVLSNEIRDKLTRLGPSIPEKYRPANEALLTNEYVVSIPKPSGQTSTAPTPGLAREASDIEYTVVLPKVSNLGSISLSSAPPSPPSLVDDTSERSSNTSSSSVNTEHSREGLIERAVDDTPTANLSQRGNPTFARTYDKLPQGWDPGILSGHYGQKTPKPTRLCFNWQRGGTCGNTLCPFQHSLAPAPPSAPAPAPLQHYHPFPDTRGPPHQSHRHFTPENSLRTLSAGVNELQIYQHYRQGPEGLGYTLPGSFALPAPAYPPSRLSHPPSEVIPPANSVYKNVKLRETYTRIDSTPIGAHGAEKMRPKTETCRKWLQGRCLKGSSCQFSHQEHGTIQHKGEKQASKPPQTTWNFTIKDSLKVRLAPGLKIQELKSRFETCYLYLENLPPGSKQQDLLKLLDTFGVVKGLRILEERSAAKVEFSSEAEASNACHALDGSTRFGPDYVLSARVPIDTTGGGTDVPPALFDDTVVVLRWDPPSRVAFIGFDNRNSAYNAVSAAHCSSLRGSYLQAELHHGVPKLGKYTVRIRHLPLDITTEDIAQFGIPQVTTFGPRNYRSVNEGIKIIKRFMRNGGIPAPDNFDTVSPGASTQGYVEATLTFSSATDAAQTATLLNGRALRDLGGTSMRATHYKTFKYTINERIYQLSRLHLEELAKYIKITADHGGRVTVAASQPAGDGASIILRAADVRAVGQLKAEVEVVLRGESFKPPTARNIWDAFLSPPSSRACIQDIESRLQKQVHIHVDTLRRSIRIFGIPPVRRRARALLLARLDELQSQQQSELRIYPTSFLLLVHREYPNILRQLGTANIFLDLPNSKLMVREAVYAQAKTMLAALQSRLGLPNRYNPSQCPVCLDAVTSPKMSLVCGHVYCRGCLQGYLNAAKDTRVFPIVCLGKEGACSEPIALRTIQSALSDSEFNVLVESSVDSFVERRPDEYRFCPTPDCPQIYAIPSSKVISTLQCPSCLARICVRCHVEHHFGFGCAAREDDGDHHLDKWAKEHDVKACPGCKVLIERAEGCNHMTCTRCQTHICWVCMKTFPLGEGIYAHMMKDHGTFGLD